MESEYLVAECLGLSRVRLVLRRQDAIPASKRRELQIWLSARQRRKPLAYISGIQPFRDRRLKVSPDVLIPRPETELVVEQAFRILDRLPAGSVAVDVGTGSGAIAICLAGHPRVGRVLAIDRSPEALRVARANGHGQGAAAIEWIEGDLLAPLRHRGEKIDLLVANLPYVRTEDLPHLEPELLWEPRVALDGGADGLRCMEPCIRQAASVLRPGGWMILEIGFDQADAIRRLLRDEKGWTQIQVFCDLSGLPRIVQAQRQGA